MPPHDRDRLGTEAVGVRLDGPLAFSAAGPSPPLGDIPYPPEQTVEGRGRKQARRAAAHVDGLEGLGLEPRRQGGSASESRPHETRLEALAEARGRHRVEVAIGAFGGADRHVDVERRGRDEACSLVFSGIAASFHRTPNLLGGQ